MEISPRIQSALATSWSDDFVDRLLEVWESSVRATHDFLSDGDINAIKDQVMQSLKEIGFVAYASDENGSICGFIGIEGDKIEMLFMHPSRRGSGIGKMFVRHAVDKMQVRHVDVNEENAQALGFYERLGFRVVGRSALDGNGNPFPILHMSI